MKGTPHTSGDKDYSINSLGVGTSTFPLENKVGSIPHISYQGKFQMDQLFKCEKLNHKNSTRKHGKILYNLEMRKTFLL